MLGLIAALLVILWLLGMMGNPAAAIGNWLPILGIVALVVIVIRLVSGRHAY